MTDKTIPIVIGGVIVAVSGYLLYRTIKKGKEALLNPVVHYASVDDTISANHIAASLNIPSSLINTGAGASDIINQLINYSTIITLGGSEANSIYREAVALGFVSPLTTPGQKVVKLIQMAGKPVWLVAGYDPADTYAAAQDFVNKFR